MIMGWREARKSMLSAESDVAKAGVIYQTLHMIKV